jgi:hypothetical protein
MDDSKVARAFLHEVSWVNSDHEYRMNLDGSDVIVHDRNGDGLLQASVDEIFINGSVQRMADDVFAAIAAKVQPQIMAFRQRLPGELEKVRKVLLQAPYTGAAQNKLCLPIFVPYSRVWVVGAVKAFDHNDDHRLDEVVFSDAHGVGVHISSLKFVRVSPDRDPKNYDTQCDWLDVSRKGVDAYLGILDALAIDLDDQEEMATIALFARLALFERASERALAPIHMEDMAETRRLEEDARRSRRVPRPNF